MRLPLSCSLSSDRMYVFHKVHILEHNAELCTVQVQQSLDGLKDVLMQDSIV